MQAEIDLVRFETIAAEAEAVRSAWYEKQRAESAARRFCRPPESLCATLDAAVPLVKQRLDAAWPEMIRDAHGNPDAFDEKLASLEAAGKAFLTAVGIERRAARIRASQRTADAAVAAAVAA